MSMFQHWCQYLWEIQIWKLNLKWFKAYGEIWKKESLIFRMSYFTISFFLISHVHHHLNFFTNTNFDEINTTLYVYIAIKRIGFIKLIRW